MIPTRVAGPPLKSHVLRPLPALDDDNRAFWTGGADGRLLIARCQQCGYYVHPPTGVCPICLSRHVTPEEVSGLGRLYTYTVNRREWYPGLTAPAVLGVVALQEQESVRFTTQIIGVDPDHVRIDMPVQVRFCQVLDVWLPLFQPCVDDGGV